MKKKGWGRIVNVASSAGKRGVEYASAYCTAKQGLIGLTKCLAAEFGGSGITVNAVCPGFSKTDLGLSLWEQRARLTGVAVSELEAKYVNRVPVGRLTRPDDVANCVNFLVSEESSHVTGEAMNVSGGLVMH